MFLDITSAPYHLVPNDVTARAANIIELTAALAAVNAAGGGTLYFPTGRWNLDRTLTKTYCLLLQNLSNIRLLGETGAVLCLAGDQGANDNNIVQLTGCRNITFENLIFSQRDATNVNEQNHMVQLGGSSGLALFNDDVQFVRCRFIEGVPGAGDGIRILGGDVNNKITRVNIDRCVFDGCTRAGIGVQRGSWTIHVTNCYFANFPKRQAIHFEPSGVVDTGQWRILHNHFENCQVTLVGTDSGRQDKYSVFAHNSMNNGELFVQYVKGAIIAHNHIVGDATQITDPTVWMESNCEDVQFKNNFVYRGPTCRPASTLQIDPHNGILPRRISVTGNWFHQFTNASLFQADSVADLEVIDNHLYFHGSATNVSGVYIQSTSASPSIYFAGNHVESELQSDGVTNAGTLTALVNVEAGFGGVVGKIHCINNRAKRVLVGLKDQNALAAHTSGLPVVNGNLFDSTVTSIIGGSGNLLTAWSLSGTPGFEGVMTGTIVPEGNIAAQQGTLYVCQSDNASITYMKRTGTGKTGWVLIPTGVETFTASGAATLSVQTTYVSGMGSAITLVDGDATLDGVEKRFVITGGSGRLAPTHLSDGAEHVITWGGACAFALVWNHTNSTWRVANSPLAAVIT